MKLFAAADIVITAHTGGLLNVGFMRPWSVVIEVTGYHSKPVAYDFLWGSARVHHLIIPSLTPNMSIHDKHWDPAKEELWNPTSVKILNYADRERGGSAVHIAEPEGPKGLFVGIDLLREVVTTAAGLVSSSSSNDVPPTPWRRR